MSSPAPDLWQWLRDDLAALRAEVEALKTRVGAIELRVALVVAAVEALTHGGPALAQMLAHAQ